MDVSRVKMIYRSNEVLPQNIHSHQSASKIERPPLDRSPIGRPSVNRNPFTFAKSPAPNTQSQSPKITFSIRSSMPSTIPVTSPVKNLPRESGRPAVASQIVNQRVEFVPPHQPNVLQRVHKRGCSR